MADGDVVKMTLTFWRGDQPPGTVIEVPADEVHRWKGFAVQQGDPYPSGQATDPTDGDYPKPAQRPTDSAAVSEWRVYAITLGMEQAKADKATKAELQDYVTKAEAGAKA
ncbi:hypothetical protein ACIRF8_15530 [Streptomyces sp. NPDC102406]|uniref:hypothetical protein n=1 Tax=Streptomyces sp. NPDC102406 TaxID=3366171 RepID=UPI0038185512